MRLCGDGTQSYQSWAAVNTTGMNHFNTENTRRVSKLSASFVTLGWDMTEIDTAGR